MNINTVFLDMDGVLADFVGATLKVHDKPDPWASIPSNRGQYNLHDVWGMNVGTFWTKICDKKDFWHTLEKTKECDGIMSLIDNLHNTVDVFLLSSPCMDPNSHHGKASWVIQHFPKLLNKMILSNHKHLMAKPNTLLIDDSERNINEFMKHGGRGILFPRPWNSKHILSGDSLKYVTMELRRFVR